MDDTSFLFFVAFGFLAQIIDGAIGMGYGASSSSMLLAFGLPPAVASASTHTAEVFTSGVSAISHWRYGNINKELFRRLILPGVIGAVVGAYLLTELPGDKIKPFVSIYLAALGIYILFKAFRKGESGQASCRVTPCGLIGGFLDAIGGGGWGAVVTSNLVARGHHPRLSIGSANAAEFFVTLSQSVVFLVTIGLSHWHVTAGLLVGGAIAAPLGAKVCRTLPARALMILVGTSVFLLSTRTILGQYVVLPF